MAFRLLFCLFLIHLHAAPGYFEPWGKDADLAKPKTTLSPQPSNPLSRAAESIIFFHQYHISPLHGARSNFRPTSSRYMLHAIRKSGFFLGYLQGCDRLLRENADPWLYRTIVIDKKRYKYDPVQ